jgi:hypothetical protein
MCVPSVVAGSNDVGAIMIIHTDLDQPIWVGRGLFGPRQR